MDGAVGRRRVIQSMGAAAGIAVLGGCTDDGATDGDFLETEPNYRGWFDGVSNYRRTVDMRDTESVSVEVGVQGNTGFYKFGPPAVAVSPGTLVEWTWTGKGGTHNVVAELGAFDSGKLVARKGYTYDYTFEAPAIYRYVCEPHRSLGMKGAVFVALEE